jgi:hypothetical protein
VQKARRIYSTFRLTTLICLGQRVNRRRFLSLLTKGRDINIMASYKQVKISVEPEIAESFKTACINTCVSMAAELSAFMVARADYLKVSKDLATTQSGYDTRAKRRQHVGEIICRLVEIRDHEDICRANIPENLQSGPAYENSELSLDALEQAIDLLRDAY